MIKTTDQIRVGTLWQSNIAMEASSTSNKKPIYVIRSFDKGFPLPWLCLLEGDTKPTIYPPTFAGQKIGLSSPSHWPPNTNGIIILYPSISII
jgi:hypothetical protein